MLSNLDGLLSSTTLLNNRVTDCTEWDQILLLQRRTILLFGLLALSSSSYLVIDRALNLLAGYSSIRYRFR
jgi:hypothetical protein